MDNFQGSTGKTTLLICTAVLHCLHISVLNDLGALCHNSFEQMV